MGLTRTEFWNRLGSLEIAKPIIAAGYEREALREWRDGRRPKTSFYISSFPGADENACGRQAVYGLMDIPGAEPNPPRSTAMFNQGVDIEHRIVHRLKLEGVLLTGDESEGEAQTRFVDQEHWASGAVDAIILPAFWRKSWVIELKTTSHEKVVEMRNDPSATPFSHSKYLRQIKTYIALAQEQRWCPTVTVCAECWAITTEPIPRMHWCPLHQAFDCKTVEITLDPPDGGEIIYASREENMTQVSYMVEHDPEHMRLGREKLAAWRDAFQRGEIPAHPHEGKRAMWSVDPCRFCGIKRRCKEDYKAKVMTLADSHQIAYAKSVRPAYDYESQRRAVLERWGAEDLSGKVEVA